MTLFRHEMRQGRLSLAVWTLCIGFFVLVCVLMYPEFEGQMEEMGAMFASMGGFTAAFGMDRLNIGTLTGFYAIECGSIIGLGGAFYAALTGISALAKEESGHTAEFLLTHPISRGGAAGSKLAAVFVQILVLDLACFGFGVLSVLMVGHEVPWDDLALLHTAYLLLHLELGALCFGLSAFRHSSGLGIGLGLAVCLYFANLIANAAPAADWLNYITPFAYTDGADLLTEGGLDPALVIPGLLYGAAALVLGFLHYRRKDLR